MKRNVSKCEADSTIISYPPLFRLHIPAFLCDRYRHQRPRSAIQLCPKNANSKHLIRRGVMATVARNTRRFPPDPKPSSLLGHPNDCVVNDYHMPEPPLFNERKRQRLEPRLPQPSETSQLVSKKTESQPSQHFSATTSILGQLIKDLVDQTRAERVRQKELSIRSKPTSSTASTSPPADYSKLPC